MWCLQLRFEEVGWSNRVRLDPGSDDAVPKPAEKPPAVATSRTPSEARSICRSSTSSTSMLKVFENRKRRRCKYRQPSLALPEDPQIQSSRYPQHKNSFLAAGQLLPERCLHLCGFAPGCTPCSPPNARARTPSSSRAPPLGASARCHARDLGETRREVQRESRAALGRRWVRNGQKSKQTVSDDSTIDAAWRIPLTCMYNMYMIIYCMYYSLMANKTASSIKRLTKETLNFKPFDATIRSTADSETRVATDSQTRRGADSETGIRKLERV